MFNIIKHKWIFLGFSGFLVLASLGVIIGFGLRPAIDFTGGALWQIRMDSEVGEREVQKELSIAGFDGVVAYREVSSDSILIKLKHLSEEEHQKAFSVLEEKIGPVEELRFESIGPTIGSQLKQRAFWAVILVLLAISLYVAFSFRKASYPVASWKYGLVILATLFHDVIIPTGVLAILGKIQGTEIDTNFIVALLVIMGFSVHDTIVVFDRIRENVLSRLKEDSFGSLVNTSVWQTMARSINTSLTLVLVLLAMFLFGGATLKTFVLILIIGTVIGTYSSIFVASPLLTLWSKSGKL